MSNSEIELLRQEHDRTKQQYLELLETRANKIKEVESDRTKLLESSTRGTNKLRDEARELRAQLAIERADREEVETELADLRQKSATARELPDAYDLLNQLKAKLPKSKVTPAEVQAILYILES